MVSPSVMNRCGLQAKLVLDVEGFIADMAGNRFGLENNAFFTGIAAERRGLSDRQFLRDRTPEARRSVQSVVDITLAEPLVPKAVKAKVEGLIDQGFRQLRPNMTDEEVRELWEAGVAPLRDLAIEEAIVCACGGGG